MRSRQRTAYAVIGAGYGDEGKGLMTDFLASKGADVVVRSNGGAQAGHTVQAADGARHVFHHFASGALAGTPSHLSRHFVSHPMVFMSERDELSGKGWGTSVTADPRGIVTTPWDVMINQFIEDRRGSRRHGSCGVGFGEAIERSLRPQYLVTVGDLHQGRDVRDRLAAIRSEWVAVRLAGLGGGLLTRAEAELVSSDAVLERFLEDCAAFAAAVGSAHDASLRGTVVFEGAQGLLLDQDYGAFPHVTRSNTGITNMSAVALEAGISRVEATYMTRAYVTRHGAGPLAHEGEAMDFADIRDPTNMPNDWQGSIRAAPLDLDVLREAVAHDVTTCARRSFGRDGTRDFMPRSDRERSLRFFKRKANRRFCGFPSQPGGCGRRRRRRSSRLGTLAARREAGPARDGSRRLNQDSWSGWFCFGAVVDSHSCASMTGAASLRMCATASGVTSAFQPPWSPARAASASMPLPMLMLPSRTVVRKE